MPPRFTRRERDGRSFNQEMEMFVVKYAHFITLGQTLLVIFLGHIGQLSLHSLLLRSILVLNNVSSFLPFRYYIFERSSLIIFEMIRRVLESFGRLREQDEMRIRGALFSRSAVAIMTS